MTDDKSPDQPVMDEGEQHGHEGTEGARRGYSRRDVIRTGGRPLQVSLPVWCGRPRSSRDCQGGRPLQAPRQ